MNKDVVKYGLIGAAVYFVWPYLRAWFDGLGVGDEPIPAVSTTTAATTAARVPDTARTAAAQTAAAAARVPDTDRVAATQTAAAAALAAARGVAAMDNSNVAALATNGDAAAVAESDRRGLVYDHHQWNYFRALASGEQPDPELWAPGATGAVVSVSQYLAARAAVGMSGLGGNPALMWVT